MDNQVGTGGFYVQVGIGKNTGYLDDLSLFDIKIGEL
jgi:hypothetical protein